MNMAEQCLAHEATQVAIIDLTGGDRRDVTYGDLADMTDGLARALVAQVQPGDRVGVLLSQTPWCAAAHLAIWKIGAISVPLFKLFKHDALASRITDAGIDLILTDGEGVELVGDLATCWMAETAGIVAILCRSGTLHRIRRRPDLYLWHHRNAQGGVAWARGSGRAFAWRGAQP